MEGTLDPESVNVQEKCKGHVSMLECGSKGYNPAQCCVHTHYTLMMAQHWDGHKPPVGAVNRVKGAFAVPALCTFSLHSLHSCS